MAYALQLLINGVALGAIYGLIAVGYTLVYGIAGLINFAHGDVFMIGGFLSLIGLTAFAAAGTASVPLALAATLAGAAGIAALYGWALERVAYRPLRGSFRLAPLISAIGASIVLQNFVQLAQGADQKSAPAPLAGGVTLLEADGFAVRLEYSQIAVVVVAAAALAALAWLVGRTRLGRAMRAVEQDAGMARLLGIDADATIAAAFGVGAAFAAVAGLLWLLRYHTIYFLDGFVPGIKAFAAAVLGGIGSLPGAVLGGLLIGLIETAWSGYGPAEYKDVAAFAVLALTLIVRPAGLLGRHAAEKV